MGPQESNSECASHDSSTAGTSAPEALKVSTPEKSKIHSTEAPSVSTCVSMCICVSMSVPISISTYVHIHLYIKNYNRSDKIELILPIVLTTHSNTNDQH